jgi:hypothetical protein
MKERPGLPSGAAMLAAIGLVAIFLLMLYTDAFWTGFLYVAWVGAFCRWYGQEQDR